MRRIPNTFVSSSDRRSSNGAVRTGALSEIPALFTRIEMSGAASVVGRVADDGRVDRQVIDHSRRELPVLDGGQALAVGKPERDPVTTRLRSGRREHMAQPQGEVSDG
jgi:hypothetical protein